MKPPSIIIRGARTYKLPGEKLSQSVEGLDVIEMGFSSDDPDYIKIDARVPGYYNMFVKSRTRTKVAGGQYVFQVVGRGLAENDRLDRRDDEYPRFTDPSGDLDSAEDSWITRNKNLIRRGDKLDGYIHMYCHTRAHTPLGDGWYRVTATFKGLQDNDKPYKRSISSNNQVREGLELDATVDPPVERKVMISQPTVVVKNFIVTRDGPKTHLTGKALNPPNPPAVPDPIMIYKPRHVTPNGWVLQDVEGDYLEGSDIWAGTETYEYVWANIPE